jgi:DNA-binding transcriptional LysR family regulator
VQPGVADTVGGVDLVQHLRYFLAVAEELHFGRAAARLHMAQPPLSQRIRRLEREYATALFDRSGGRVTLTAAGLVLKAEAEAIVARTDRSRELVRRAAAGAGPLRVGLPPQTPARLVTALASGIDGLELRELPTAAQIAELAAGRLDAGLLRQPGDAPALSVAPAVAIPHGVVVARTSPLARRFELAIDELAGEDLVLYPRDAAPLHYDEILRVCPRHGAIRHAGRPEVLLGLVAAGQGIAFEQRAIAEREPRVRWRPLTGTPLVWRISPAWPRDAPHHQVTTFNDIALAVLGDEALAPAAPTAPPAEPRPWSVVYPTSRTGD